jgi:hypothetical protein
MHLALHLFYGPLYSPSQARFGNIVGIPAQVVHIPPESLLKIPVGLQAAVLYSLQDQ